MGGLHAVDKAWADADKGGGAEGRLVEALDFVTHDFPVDLNGLGVGIVDWCELVYNVHVAFEVKVLESAAELLVQKHALVRSEAGGDGCVADFGRFKVPRVCVFGDEVLGSEIFEGGGDGWAQGCGGVCGGVEEESGADVVVQRVGGGRELSSYSLQ